MSEFGILGLVVVALVVVLVIVLVRAGFSRLKVGCKVGKVVDLHVTADKGELRR